MTAATPSSATAKAACGLGGDQPHLSPFGRSLLSKVVEPLHEAAALQDSHGRSLWMVECDGLSSPMRRGVRRLCLTARARMPTKASTPASAMGCGVCAYGNAKACRSRAVATQSPVHHGPSRTPVHVATIEPLPYIGSSDVIEASGSFQGVPACLRGWTRGQKPVFLIPRA